MHLFAHCRESRLSGPARMLFVLILSMGPVLALYPGTPTSLVLDASIKAGWTAGPYGPGNVPNPGQDFNPGTITRAATCTATYNSGNVNARTYSFRVNKDADEATTWNTWFEVWICPISGTGNGSSAWSWTVPLGTWVMIPSSGEQEICTFVLGKNRSAAISFQIQIRNITTRAGPGAPFTTAINYRVY